MNEHKDITLDQLNNSYVDLLAKQLNIESVFTGINVESIEDETTRIICRTLLGSSEALKSYLEIKV